jgi:hypothetical protein
VIYFVIRNLGYDGLIIYKADNKEEAEELYNRELSQIKREIEAYGIENTDLGVALIEGSILKSQDIEFD